MPSASAARPAARTVTPLRVFLLGGSALCGAALAALGGAAMAGGVVLPTQGGSNLATSTANGSLAATVLSGAPAAPTGVTIGYTSNGATANVNLTANRTVIDWTTFQVSNGATLNFNFGAGANDIVINRVISGAITVDKGGTVAGLYKGSTGGNVWFLADGGVFLHGTVTANGVLAVNSTKAVAVANLLSDDITALKGELAAAASLIDLTGTVTATDASVDQNGNIVLNGDVNTGAAGAVDLVAGGAISQTAGVITAASLTGSSVGGASLTDNNLFGVLAGFTNTGAGPVAISDALASGLTVTGAVSAGAGNNLSIAETAGPLTVAAPITVIGGSNGNQLGLTAASLLAIDAPVAADGQVSVALGYNGASAANFLIGGTGALTFNNADGSAATASAGGALSVNGQGYTLLYQLAQSGSTGPDKGTNDIAGIDSNGPAGKDKGDYALAVNVAGTGSSASPQFTTALVGGGAKPFSGVFLGLGHTVSNLTIADTTTGDSVGLFGVNTGTIAGLGLSGGSVNGVDNASVGALVGQNQAGGVVLQDFATAAVIAGQSAGGGGLVGANAGSIVLSFADGSVSAGATSAVGGLVGGNTGSVSQSYATGDVTGAANGFAGGLVGVNYGPTIHAGYNGLISQAYATGAVSGGAGANVGGLVGNNDNTISQSYATGAVSGGSGAHLGGLAGGNDTGGTIASSVFDTQTTGMSAGIGRDQNGQSANVTGLTTSQLQTGGLPAAFAASAWGGGAGGIYPFLSGIDINGVQTVSGVVYSDAGVTPAGSGASGAVDVNLALNGVASPTQSAGADGYYYFALPNGSLSLTAGTTVLTWTAANAATGAANSAALTLANAPLAGFNLYAGDLLYQTPALTYSGSALASNLAAAEGFASAPGFLGSLSPYILATGASFTLDTSLTLMTPMTVQTTAPGAAIDVTATIYNYGASSLSLLAAGQINLQSSIYLTGGALTLAAGGPVSQTSGSIQVSSLTGSSVGGTSLTNSANEVGDLGPFTNTGGGGFALTDGSISGLTVTGAVDAGAGGTLTLFNGKGPCDNLCVSILTLGANLTAAGGTVSVGSLGGIVQTAGVITTGTLTGSSGGGAALKDQNLFDNLGPFANTGGGDLSITDAKASGLTVNGPISVGKGNLTLTTVNGGSLTLAADVTAPVGTVDLESAGAISQTAGVITATNLTGTSAGGASLAGANQIVNLAGFTNTGAGGLSLSDASDAGLTVTAAVDAGTGNTLALTTTTAGGGLTLAANLTASGGTVDLVSAAALSQSAGVITTASLTGSSVGGASLTNANLFDSLAGFANTGQGDVSISDAKAGGLSVTKTVDAGSGNNLNLVTTNGGSLTLGASLSAAGGTVDLVAAGAVTQTGGVITTGTITGSSAGGFGLVNNNRFGAAQLITNAGSGDVIITDALDLAASSISNPVGSINLTSLGALSLNGAAIQSGLDLNLSAGTTLTVAVAPVVVRDYAVTALAFAGQALNPTFNPGRDFTVNGLGALTLPVSLTAPRNLKVTAAGALDTIGVALAASGGTLTLVGGAGLSVGQTTDTAGATTFSTTAGGIALDGQVNAGTQTLDIASAGTIAQGAPAVITAGILTGSAAGGASLTAANQIADLGAFTNTGGGAVSFTGALGAGLTVTGAVDAGPGGALTLTAAGGPLSLQANVSASGGSVDLVSAGTISQTAGAITTAALTGASSGGASLTGANRFDTLNGFVNTASGGLSLTDAKTSGLTVTGVVDASLGAQTAGALTLVSAGAIAADQATITAGTLTGSSVGGASFNQQTPGALNAVASFGSFTNTGGGALVLADGQALAASALSNPAGSITLTTLGAGANLTVTGAVNTGSGTLTLDSAGLLNASGATLTAGTLTGASSGGADLTGTNQFDSLGGFANSGAGGLSITDARASGLTVTGAVDAGAANTLVLTTANGGSLTLGASLTAAGGTVQLNSAGTITQTGGVITAANLSSTSKGAAVLNRANQVADLIGFTNGGSGTLAFTDALATGLTVTQDISAGAGDIDLASTAAGAGLNLTVNLSTNASHQVSLTSAGAIDQTAGIITTGTLSGSSSLGASLAAGNLFDTLAGFINTGAGAVTINDARTTGLTVSAAVNAGANNALSLTTAGPLTLAAGLSAAGGTVNLASGGSITQTGGVITAADLSSQSQGAATLTDANQVADLVSFTNGGTGTLAFTSAGPGGLTLGADITAGAGDVDITSLAAGAPLSLSVNLTTDGAHAVSLSSGGPILQVGGSILTGSLSLTSVGGANLTLGNRFFNLTGVANSGGGVVDITDGQALSVTGAANAGAGGVLVLTAAGPLDLAANLSAAGGAVNLQAEGAIVQTAGVITAASLTSSSVGSSQLTGANRVGVLSAFTNGGAGDLSFTDSLAFTLGSAIDAGFGNLTLTSMAAGATLPVSVSLATNSAYTVTLISAGAISQTGGIISTGTLTGSSVGGASLTAANPFSQLAGFTNTGAGNVSITAAGGLTVTSAVDAGAGNTLTLTTLSGGALTLAADLTAAGGAVDLVSAGAISQSGGIITTGALTGSSVGGASLTGANLFDTLAGFTNLDASNVSITDAKASGLTVTSAVDAGAGNALTLTTLNGGSLTLAASLTAAGGSVDLVSAGTLNQTAGIITAGSLTGSSVGGASLAAGNLFDTLAGFANTGAGDVSITDAKASGLTVASAVDAGAGNSLTLTTTHGGSLTLAANLSAAGGTVDLASSGFIVQTGGVIDATNLTGVSTGGASLTAANLFDRLTGFTNAGVGSVSITGAKAGGVAVKGAVDAGAGNTLTLTTLNGGALVLAANLTAANGAVDLAASGSISQTGGIITTGSLSGASAGGANLAASNLFDTLAGFANTGAGNVSITDAKASGLAVAGPVDAGAGNSLTLTTTNGGSMDLAANLSAIGGAIDLASAGAISQAGGIISTGTLTASSVGGASLTAANPFSQLAGFTNTGAGNVSITAAGGLAVTSAVDAGAGNTLTLTTLSGGGLTLTADLTAAGGTVDLVSAGAISQSGGIITTGALTGSSVGGASLTGANLFDTLAGFTNLDASNVSITDAKASGLTVTSAVDAGAGNALTLTTLNGGSLTLAANLTAAGGSVDLVSAGTLNQTAGIITAASLTGSSVGGASLAAGNLFDALAGFANTGAGDVSITDAKASGLTVASAVDAGAGNTLTLTTLNGGSLTLAANLSASGGEVDLASSGPITQTGGVIETATLTGASAGGASLTSANLFDTLAGFTNAGVGNVAITDAKASGLTVTSAVDAGAGNTLTLTTLNGGDLTLDADITAANGTVVLSSAGTIDQTGGIITTGALAVSAVGASSLSANNQFAALAGFTGTGDVSIADANPGGLMITGPVQAGAGDTLTVTTLNGGSLTLAASLTAAGGAVDLVSAGAISQTGGAITTGTLTGSSVGGASLTGANTFAVLAGFENVDSGALTIVDGVALSVTGKVDNTAGAPGGGGRDVSITLTSGDLTGAGVFSAARDVALQTQAGSMSFATATAGDDLVLRASGAITVKGALTAAGTASAADNADSSAAGDRLAGSAPMSAAGLVYAGLTDGSHIDAVAGGNISLGGPAQAAGDVRLQSVGGSVFSPGLSAGRDIVVDASGLASLGDLTAGGDVALWSHQGNVAIASALAGDDVVIRADNGSILVSGDLAAGTAAGGDIGRAGAALAATDPLALFGSPEPGLPGGSADLGAQTVTLGGAVTAGLAAGTPVQALADIRIVATGPDSQTGGQAVLVSGAATATGDIALDSRGGGILAGGALTAGRDVALWAEAGNLGLVSASAGDDIALRASGALSVSGALTAGTVGEAYGAADILTAASPLVIFGQTYAGLADGSHIDVSAGGNVTLGGPAQAGGDVRLQSRGGSISGLGVTAGRDIALDAAGGINAGALGAGRDVAVQARSGNLNLASAAAGGDIVLRSALATTVSGDLSAGGGPQGPGATDTLAAASPMKVFGHSYVSLTDGTHVDIIAGGDLTIGGTTSAATDVRLQSLGGAVSTGNLTAGRDIVIAASTSVGPGAAIANAFAAGGDIAVLAQGGSISTNGLTAGGNVVLRAGTGAVMVNGAIGAGAGDGGGASGGAGGYLAAYAPSSLFGAADPALTGADVDIQAKTVDVTGAVAAGASGDVRVVATGLDPSGSTLAALTLAGGVSAGRDVALDAVGAGTSDNATATGSILVGGPTTAGRDVAGRSQTGSVTLTSAGAGDDVVFVAPKGEVNFNGSVSAVGSAGSGIGQTLFATVNTPLDGLFTLGGQSIFIFANSYYNAGYGASGGASLSAGGAIGIDLTDTGGLVLADADPKTTGSWVQASTLLAPTVSLFETGAPITVGGSTINSPVANLNLYTGGTVNVTGVLAPAKDNTVTLAIGTPDPTAAAAAWTPNDIYVINDAGAGTNAGAIGETTVSLGGIYSSTPRTFYAAALYAKVNILLGTQAFIQANADLTTLAQLMQIDPSRPVPASAANDSLAVMLAAGDLSLSAGSLIVQQNTTGLRTTDGTGYYITRTLGLGSYGPNPPAIDLFGVFTRPGTTIPITGPAAADVTQIYLLGDLASSPYRGLYRVNSCVIGELGNCTPTTDAIISIPLDQLSRGALLSRDELDVEDPTITGAPNEEIWRKPDDAQ